MTPDSNIPAGWVLVPVEATPEMIAAGAHTNSEWLDDAAPLNERRYRDPAKSVYRDMLNAAPSLPHAAAPQTLGAHATAMGEALVALDARLRECFELGHQITAEEIYDSSYQEMVADAVLNAAPKAPEPTATMSALVSTMCSKWGGEQLVKAGDVVDFVMQFPYAAPKALAAAPSVHSVAPPIQPLPLEAAGAAASRDAK